MHFVQATEKDGTTQNGLWKVLMPEGDPEQDGIDSTSAYWNQVGSTISHYQDQDDSNNNYRCGIKLSDDGTYVAVGDPNYKDPDTGHTVGVVYVYRQVVAFQTALNSYYPEGMETSCYIHWPSRSR